MAQDQNTENPTHYMMRFVHDRQQCFLNSAGCTSSTLTTGHTVCCINRIPLKKMVILCTIKRLLGTSAETLLHGMM